MIVNFFRNAYWKIMDLVKRIMDADRDIWGNNPGGPAKRAMDAPPPNDDGSGPRPPKPKYNV